MDLKAVSHDALASAYEKAKEKPPASQYTQNRLVVPGSVTGIRSYEIDGLVESFRANQRMNVTWEIMMPSYGNTIRSNGMAVMPELKPAEIRFYHTQTLLQKQNMSDMVKYSLVLNLLLVFLFIVLPFLRG
jgi:hypothetical protein